MYAAPSAPPIFSSQLGDKRSRCLREISRQFTHPDTGLGTYLRPRPTTLGEWHEMLSNCQGWCNAGIEMSVADIFFQMGLGEVVPNSPPDMDIYNERFCFKKILAKLKCGDDPENNDENEFRVVMNFRSFEKLAHRVVQIIKNPQEVQAFVDDFTRWSQEVNQRLFWVNIPIPEDVSQRLGQLMIGEVIPNRGRSRFNNLEEDRKEEKKNPPELHYWKEALEEEDEEEDDEDDDMEKDCLSDLPKEQPMGILRSETTQEQEFYTGTFGDDTPMSTGNDVSKENELVADSPFRLIMNQKSCLNMLEMAVAVVKPQYSQDLNKENAFHMFGGYEDNLIAEFSKLKF